MKSLILCMMVIVFSIASIPVPSYDPFGKVEILIKKQKKIIPISMEKSKKKIKLSAILNNQAYISDKWYKKGSYVHGYKITKISKDYILIKRGKMKKILTINHKQDIIKIRNKK